MAVRETLFMSSIMKYKSLSWAETLDNKSTKFFGLISKFSFSSIGLEFEESRKIGSLLFTKKWYKTTKI